MTADDLSSLRALAAELAEVAGAAIRPHFRRPAAFEIKADASPVTVADRAAEWAMRDLIGARRPGDGVVGEEFAAERPEAEWVWVLDPIDGTRAFLSGLPTFGTLIALLHEGRPLLGVIDQPISGERWTGVMGEGTDFRDGGGGAARPVRTRRGTPLGEAWLFCTAPEQFRGEDEAAFRRLYAAIGTPRYGFDCYAYAMLATGFVDLVVEATLEPYDYLALAPVVEAAGGVMTDWAGAALGLESDGRVLAAGDAALHGEALARLRGGWWGERPARPGVEADVRAPRRAGREG